MVLFLYIVLLSIPRIVLSVLQIRHIENELKKKPYILEQQEYQEAGAYAKRKEKLSMVEALLDAILFVAWMTFGLSALDGVVGDKTILAQSVAVLVFFLLGWLCSLPLELYKIFCLDRDFGFSKTTPKLFLFDLLKQFLLLCLLGGPIVAILIWTIGSFELWWVYGFGLLFGVVLFANLLYPTIIAPMFNKFSPLEDVTLKEKIDGLLRSVGFQNNGVYVMDASRRDGRLNAYFGGLGKSKRVVLFDTLLQKVSPEGIIAILGHELGHFKHGDIWKSIVFMGLMIFGLFALAGAFPQFLYDVASVEKSPFSTLCLLSLLATPIGFYSMPLFGIISRHNEYAADQFGATVGSIKDLRVALMALVSENKAFPSSHPLYIMAYFTHPPLVERLKRLGWNNDD